MNGAIKNGRLIRFSIFELDRNSGELFKQGRKVKLQGQPFELLLALLERPGEVLTREELRERVWPSDSAGDFDHGLNRAVNRMREALGDSAETPRFIETLPRRGYRFIGSIQEENGAEPPAVEPLPNEAVVQTLGPAAKDAKQGLRRTTWLVATAVVGVAAFLLIWWWTHRTPVSPKGLELRQLTTNSSENPVSNAIISPDGKYLAYGDSIGIRLQQVATGETHALPKPQTLSDDDAWFPSAWFPDGSRIVASAVKVIPDGRATSSLWSVPVLGGNPVLLRENAIAPAVSPDGSLIAFTKHVAFDSLLTRFSTPWTREIWVMGPNGEDARKLLSSNGKALYLFVHWSPDSTRVAYIGMHPDSTIPFATDLETIGLKGGSPVVAVPVVDDGDGSFFWVSDGRIVYARPESAPNIRDANLWALKVDPKTGKPQSRPVQITNLPGFGISNVSTSSDGKRLIFQKNSNRNDVYIGRLDAAGNLESTRRLTSDERSTLPWAWTLDSKSLIFTSDRTGVNAIYKQQIEQTLAELIPTGPERVWLPRVTPDGSSILYLAQPDIQHPWQSRTIRLMKVPISGGAREQVMQLTALGGNLDCPIQPNKECVIEKGSDGGAQVTFIAFDPLRGKQRALFTTNGSHQWTLSPDGAHIAELDSQTIEILSLTGQIEQTIQVKGWPYLRTIDWTADGKALLVSRDGPTKVTLLRVGLDGQTRPLWETNTSLATWAIASPDSRYLAIMGHTLNSNAWLLENF